MPVRVLQLAMEKATAMGIQKFKGDSPVWTAEYTTAVVQYICNSWQFTQEGANTGFSMGISYPSNASIGVACGPAFLGDKKPYQLATPDSIFAMGSTTKMITAAAILKLVEDGKMSLNDKMLPRMEKAYKTLYAKFQDKKDAAGSPTHPDLVAWLGPEIKDITIGQMLMMESGIPDFDNMVSRTYQLKHPKVNLGPMENIDFIHFTKPDQPSQKKWDCKPGTCRCYSSSNYEFAGLVLMQAADVSDWKQYDQWAALPKSIRDSMPHSLFPVEPLCSELPKMVDGWTPTLAEEGIPLKSVYHTSCTNGWTCGNIASNGQDAANFARRYLTTDEYLSEPMRKLFVEKLEPMSKKCGGEDFWGAGKPYGLGLFDASYLIYGEHNHKFIGHPGETYGFNANTGASMEFGFGVSIVMNTEVGFPTNMGIFQLYWVAALSMGKVTEQEVYKHFENVWKFQLKEGAKDMPNVTAIMEHLQHDWKFSPDLMQNGK